MALDPLGPPPTADELADYLRVPTTDPRVAGALAGAVADLTDALTDRWRNIPDATYAELVLEVAAERYRRRDQPAGTATEYADLTPGPPMRGPRDPLTPVIPTIRRYVTGL